MQQQSYPPPPPYYPTQQSGYPPQAYPQAPPPAGQYYYGPTPPPQVIYRDAPRSQGPDANTCWLLSLLTLCCGCIIGDVCCDANVCCCLIPCALPRFR